MGAKHGELRELITEMFRERHKKPHLTVNLLRQHWQDILGQELARKTYPARIAGQILWVNALDASWAYQLQFMKHELLESVQVFMGAQDIIELRFKQGDLHAGTGNAESQDIAGEEHRPNTPGTSGVNNTDTAEHREEAGAREEENATEAAKAITDDSLRDSFSRWARVKQRKNPTGS